MFWVYMGWDIPSSREMFVHIVGLLIFYRIIIASCGEGKSLDADIKFVDPKPPLDKSEYSIINGHRDIMSIFCY